MEDEYNHHGTDISRHPRKHTLSSYNPFGRASSNLGDDVGSSGFTSSKKNRNKNHQRIVQSDEEDVDVEILNDRDRTKLRNYEEDKKSSLNRYPSKKSGPAARQVAPKQSIDVDVDSGDEMGLVPDVPDKSYNRIMEVDFDDIPHSSPPVPSSSKAPPPAQVSLKSRPRPTPKAKEPQPQTSGQEGIRTRLLKQG